MDLLKKTDKIVSLLLKYNFYIGYNDFIMYIYICIYHKIKYVFNIQYILTPCLNLLISYTSTGNFIHINTASSKNLLSAMSINAFTVKYNTSSSHI